GFRRRAGSHFRPRRVRSSKLATQRPYRPTMTGARVDRPASVSAQSARTADRARAATGRAASTQLPAFLDNRVVPASFNADRLGWIGLNLPKAPCEIIQLIRDDNDLAVGDADEFVGVRRLRIIPRLLIDSTGQLPVEVLYRVGAGHAKCLQGNRRVKTVSRRRCPRWSGSWNFRILVQLATV